MTRYFVTPAEAGLLKAIDEMDSTAIHQLASTIRVTPGEAIDISKSLEGKDFAIFDESHRMVHLTGEGRHVRHLLQRQSALPFSATASTPNDDLVLVADKESPDDEREETMQRLGAEDLEKAIEKELEQLQMKNSSRKE
jgi:DNA-binding MarR family transcriptional regulator